MNIVLKLTNFFECMYLLEWCAAKNTGYIRSHNIDKLKYRSLDFNTHTNANKDPTVGWFGYLIGSWVIGRFVDRSTSSH